MIYIYIRFSLCSLINHIQTRGLFTHVALLWPSFCPRAKDIYIHLAYSSTIKKSLKKSQCY